MIDLVAIVVIDSGRVAADNSEGVVTADSDGVMIDSVAVQQDPVTVASLDANFVVAKAEIDSEVPVQTVINSDRWVVIDSDVMVSAVMAMWDSG